jgi:hypothetical protein
MKTKVWKYAGNFWILFALIFVTAVHSSEKVEGDIKKSFKVESGGLLTLETDIGSIEVQTREGSMLDVEVRFTQRRGSRNRIKELLEDFDVDFRHDGRDVTIIAEYRRDGWNFWDSFGRYLRVEFLVSVPRKYNLDLKTSGGSVSVDDLEGEVVSRTSGGSLSFGRIQGPVKGKTYGGSITLDGCEGNADVKTSGGSIRIGKVNGPVYAHTSGGGIDVEEVMGAIDAKTSGGSVTASISRQPENDCRLTTSGGSITVYLDKDIKVDVNARTSGGRVRTDFPVTVRGELSTRSLQAKINGGGPELYLRTSGGSISIREM